MLSRVNSEITQALAESKCQTSVIVYQKSKEHLHFNNFSSVNFVSAISLSQAKIHEAPSFFAEFTASCPIQVDSVDLTGLSANW